MKTFKEFVKKEKIPAVVIIHDHSSNRISESTRKETDPIHDELTQSEDLSDPEKDELKRYSRSSFDLNATLIGRHHLDQPVTESVHGHHLPTLDRLTRKPIGRKLSVFSGVGFDPQKEANSEGLLHLPAYTSSSLVRDVGHDFAEMQRPAGAKMKHILHIHMEPHNQGIYTANHGHSFEREMLLPRKTTLRITKSEPSPDYPNTMIHHATVENEPHPDGDIEKNPQYLTKLPERFHYHYKTNQEALTPENRSRFQTEVKKEKARKAQNMASITDLLKSLK